MAVKNLSTRVAIIGRGAKCRGGSSAVDKSAYISRTTMYSEYDGTTYYPKYTEDLVHNEVMLPVNAPAEYSDPSVLWNSVEMRESKSAKAQLARSYKINLPNEWSYELAIEVMRDYVKRNFVDDGMCAQFAIHDSENPNTHQRNLHCHIMLTMRPILEDGSWGDKQKKIYALDADGNKIRKKNGQYKCTTQDVTGWNSRENARKWRKDLADTINAVNDKNGLRENFWEHRSFAEQGLDTIPQIHLGEKASALERAGIQTERGNVNRRIMPAVKANAYGHGAVLIAKALQEKGIRAFCVASVTEGVELRKNGITGTILILGYTHPDSFPLLWKYRLTQTVVDYPYAQSLNACRKKVQVHLKIDTGMHRLGIRSDHIEEISRMFQMDNLLVDGIYTHLCVSDSMTAADREFTYQQANAFYTLLEKLSERGISCPNIHLSASYGLIHYPEFPSNYARIGIALYGMLSSRQDEENCSIPLFPVLSVKARVSSVRDLYKGEGAGYGLRYVAKENRQIAVLSIGYADGIPRSLSNGHGRVLINGQFAPIIGNICMDQMLVDVTDIKEVKQGDIAVLIGKSGDLEITAYDLAEQTESITNEILSRLGARLERILI